ncbi:hypothetical protein BDN71DRAFT_1360905, partial [Pleurotus eryngii]
PFVGTTVAICPGFNFGIGNLRVLGGGVNRCAPPTLLSMAMLLLTFLHARGYNTCNVVDGLTTNINPCTQGIFACSPPPVIFNGYTNTLTGL